MTIDQAPTGPRCDGHRIFRGLATCFFLSAVLLPPDRVVDVLSLRFRTVAGFRSDFVRGLQVLRAALALAAVVTALLPALIRRSRLTTIPFRHPERADLATAALLFLATAVTAFPGLFQSWQDDEWRVVEQYIRHGPGVILTRNQGDNHLLHALLVWPFTKLFGVGEVAARLPVWLGGSLGAPLLFFLLRQRGQHRVPAGVAALLLGLSPFLLQFVHESRAYALLPPCVFGLLILQPSCINGDSRAWVLSTGLAAAIPAFHLFAAPVVLAVFLAPLADPKRRRPELCFRLASALLVAGAIAFLAYALVFPQMLDTAGVQARHPATSIRPEEVFSRLFVMSLPFWMSLPFMGLLVAGFRSPPDRNVGVALLVSLPLQIGLLMAVASEIAPRFLAPLLAIAWVVIADGLGRLWPHRRGWTSMAILLLALTVMAGTAYYRIGNRDYRGVAAELARRRLPGETVAGRFDARPLMAYLSPLPAITNEEGLQAQPPDWLIAVDVNLERDREFAAWVEHRYVEAFRIPSLRGALLGLRRR